MRSKLRRRSPPLPAWRRRTPSSRAAGVVHAAPVDITLLNINDFHGRIDPANNLTTRWATTIENERVIDTDASCSVPAT